MTRGTTALAVLALACAMHVATDASASGVRPEDWAPGAMIKRIAAGSTSSCAITGDGLIRCWGSNSAGELGVPRTSTASSNVPIRASISDRALMISVVGFTACAVMARSGDVLCWGDNNFGQVGNGISGAPVDVPTRVSGFTNARSVSTGPTSCAALVDGTVRCWGLDSFGQLGNGFSNDGSMSGVPVQVVGLTDVVDVETKSGTACALRSTGQVACWGNGDQGQLGNSSFTTPDARSSVPVEVSGLSDAIGVTVGFRHACALRRTGVVVCWGSNSDGQLGDGGATSLFSRTPVAVTSLGSVTSISAGTFHTCARRADGTARCWGGNESGQLGDGSRDQRNQRVTVTSLSGVVSLAAGAQHTCALLADDTFRCWGDGGFGNLGNGSVAPQLQPVAVSGLAGSVSARIVSAGGAHTCAVRSNGTVACWGSNGNGQLGDGTLASRALPVVVPGLASIVSIATGGFQTCALHVDGRIFCWGSNGLAPNVTTPSQIASIDDAVAITAGTLFACANLVNGTVRCWGDGRAGQLGNGLFTSSLTPVTPTGLGQNIVSVSAGVSHACAQRFDGTLRCWGSNESGQLGDGTNSASGTPRTVSGGNQFVSLAAGGQHTCATRTSGSLFCWGRNDRGQLGLGNRVPTPIPSQVSGISGVKAISAGGDSTCALGALSGVPARLGCWGRSDLGQVGFVGEDRLAPAGFDESAIGWASIDAGRLHLCVVRADGALLCRGGNTAGQVGRGTFTAAEPSLLPDIASFRLNLQPTVTLASSPRGAVVTVIANCEIGEQAKISAQVTQGDVLAIGNGLARCTGGLELVPVTVHAKNGGSLQPGPAAARAVAEIRRRGEVSTTFEWSRQANVVY